jgi:biopolymer transport protein ExbB/TolQ
VRRQFPIEFIFQLFSLIIAIIIIHGIYVSVIRPNATAILAQEAIEMNANPDYVPERSTYVVLRDFEQESCFILMAWALALMGFKANLARQERQVMQFDLIPSTAGTSILPEDTREYSRPIQALSEQQQAFLLPRTLLTALHRFRSTRNIQDVSNTVRASCASESDRLDSELSMIRYIAWAIPSIGFLGTVRGSGQALAQANKAAQGDIAGVTQSLGVAFNSTFVALLISILIMFLLHQLQLTQERLVLDSETYCDNRLVAHLQS